MVQIQLPRTVKDATRCGNLAEQKGHVAIANLLKNSTRVSARAVEQRKLQSIEFLVSDASQGNLTRVAKSLDDGLDHIGVDAVDLNGQTAISAAAQNGQDSVVALLISRGANLNALDDNCQSPLWWASRNGHASVVGQLLSAQGDNLACVVVDIPDCDRQTPLSAASQQGHARIVDLLFKNGADPNSTTEYGTSPWDFAVDNGHFEVVALLESSGALGDKGSHSSSAKKHFPPFEAKIKSSSKQHARDIVFAASYGRVAEMIRLIKVGVNIDGAGATGCGIPIIRAAQAGQELAVSTLLQYGANIEAQDGWGQTALTLAARNGHTSVVKLLADEGGKINHRCREFGTPLANAARAGHEATVKLLLELGCQKEIKSRAGGTPLWHAASHGQKGVAATLLEHGANIEAADVFGRTPLYEAVRQGHRDMARFLLEEPRGADMRPDSFRNFSPLCQAAKDGAEGIVELLIDHGAKLNHLSDASNTPIILASIHGHSMVVKTLIEAGAHVQHQNDDGRTAMSYAKEKGHEPIVKLLSRAKSMRLANGRALIQGQRAGLDKKSTYQYRPLEKDNIRVLELKPGKKDDIISFDLIDVHLHKDFKFEALSYEWKEKFGTIPVECNGQDRLLVTPNCKAALENLRLESGTRFLWIDAICINQEDYQERTEQVAMMTDIYRKAAAVLMWVGEGTEFTRPAFDSLANLSLMHAGLQKNQHSSVDLGTLEGQRLLSKLADDFMKDKDAVRGVGELYTRSYYNRAWIFQEIILAGTRGLFLCGSYQCSWKTAKVALLAYRAVTKARANTAFYRIALADDTFSKTGMLRLDAAVLTMACLDAADPRDKIFAALRLSSASIALVKAPVADYSMTTQEVYVGAARYFIAALRTMGVWDIGYRPSTKTIEKLPTWVPDFTIQLQCLRINPFRHPAPAFASFIQGRPTTTTPVSLHIDGVSLDQIALSVSLVRDGEVYDFVKPIVQALARLGRGIYDVFPGSNTVS